MAMNDEEVCLSPNSQKDFSMRALEAPHVLFADVRSTVEGRFLQMEQAHDRIRAEELAARLAAHTLN
ncbi:MAG: hypothetical protein H0U18_09205 [Pyrinomonadaceae bacterium]|nr:hypothetical protein [Pyrinomonadaceae bacterium]